MLLILFYQVLLVLEHLHPEHDRRRGRIALLLHVFQPVPEVDFYSSLLLNLFERRLHLQHLVVAKE